MSEEDLQHITDYLIMRGYQWKVGGKLRFPTEEQVAKLLEMCFDEVRRGAQDQEMVSVEIGGLLVKKTDNKIDIYLHAGEVDL